MYLLNLTLGQFLAVFGSVAAVTVALYLLDRSRRRQVVASLRFWVAAQQPAVVKRRKRIQQPFSLLLQLLSIALLLLAVAQLRWGSPAGAPRDHVLILDTSAWMAANSGGRTLMDAARERARAYVRAVPLRDRVMLVRADALTTPATAFEPDRKKLEEAIRTSVPGATALNLDQALAFARRLQTQAGRRAGEIVFAGAGRTGESDALTGPAPMPRNFRVLMTPDTVENCGLRKIGLRRSASDPDVWEIYVAMHNYGTAPRAVMLALAFGPSREGASVAVGSRRLTLAPGADQEATFEYRTRAAGLLEAALLPHDDFPEDDNAILELPSQPVLPVTVYSEQPDLLRPVLDANPRLKPAYLPPSAYRADDHAQLVILDRFRPPSRPKVASIWIDPPPDGSPIPIRSRVNNVPFAHWHSDDPLAAGLRTKDFRLAAASVFEPAPGDIKVGEVQAGPVIVARPDKPKTVVLGFHPALSAVRYELATPLLFGNILRWLDADIFRHSELTAGSVGTIKMMLAPNVRASDVRVAQENGAPVPFTVHDGGLHFYAGTPGVVRVLAGDHEYVYSLTLPQLWEARWQPPANVRHGVPRFAAMGDSSIELWQWLALAGAAGLLLEWFLYGRFGRGVTRMLAMRAPRRKAVTS